MGYIGMCHCEGYGFQAVHSGIGCINQSAQVQNRVSLFFQATDQLVEDLSLHSSAKPGIATQKYKKIKSANLYLCNSAYSATQDPSGTPHPKIPKVTPPPPPNYKQETKELENQTTILVKTFGTLCVSSEGNVIQVDPPPPPRLTSECWVLQAKHFLHILHMVRTSTSFGGVGEKSCLGHVYECVSQVSCKFHRKTRGKGKVYQNLLARIVG